MFNRILDLAPSRLHSRSGGVLYSGRAAFEGARPLYLLGLNPAGDPAIQANDTIASSIAAAKARTEANWSAYADEVWDAGAGDAKLQRRILHLLKSVGQDPRTTPASNVVFVRTPSERELALEKRELLKDCWPLHKAVIAMVGVRVIACMGATAGAWVRDQVGAHRLIDSWTEPNRRRWTSTCHMAGDGFQVLTLAHPSYAAWNTPFADPSALVAAALDRL